LWQFFLYLQNMKKTEPPLIVTLGLEAPFQEQFNALRAAHFPRNRNYLEAHLTLFYRLPSTEEKLRGILHQFASGAPLQLEVDAVKNIGKGVVFSIASDELQQLHRDMQQAFDPWLIRQDRKPLWPHITIQNNVTAYKAMVLSRTLQATFQPFTMRAISLQTWYYRGGPWKQAEEYFFRQV